MYTNEYLNSFDPSVDHCKELKEIFNIAFEKPYIFEDTKWILEIVKCSDNWNGSLTFKIKRKLWWKNQILHSDNIPHEILVSGNKISSDIAQLVYTVKDRSLSELFTIGSLDDMIQKYGWDCALEVFQSHHVILNKRSNDLLLPFKTKFCKKNKETQEKLGDYLTKYIHVAPKMYKIEYEDAELMLVFLGGTQLAYNKATKMIDFTLTDLAVSRKSTYESIVR